MPLTEFPTAYIVWNQGAIVSIGGSASGLRLPAAKFTANTSETRVSSSASMTGGVASSTWWPSSSSSFAVSCAAAAHAGAQASASTPGCGWNATRRRPGSTPASSANGRSGGGAQNASPFV